MCVVFFFLSLDLLQVIGKRGRIVPIILTKDVKEAIDLIVKKRQEVGVSADNKYVFARPNQHSQSYVRGWDSLKEILGQVGDLERPDLITSTKLRKYIATVAQVCVSDTTYYYSYRNSATLLIYILLGKQVTRYRIKRLKLLPGWKPNR